MKFVDGGPHLIGLAAKLFLGDCVLDQIELTGLSGQRYRFRRALAPAALPAQGGNFVYVKHVGGAAQVLACGAGESLLEAKDHWVKMEQTMGADSIFFRLNITRTLRLREHEDIAAVNGISTEAHR